MSFPQWPEVINNLSTIELMTMVDDKIFRLYKRLLSEMKMRVYQKSVLAKINV